jgi:hypothetical protein
MRRTAAFAFVFLALLPGGEAASAGERPLPAAPPPVLPQIDGDGRSVHPPTGTPEARDEEPESRTTAPPLEHRSILLDLASLHPSRWDEVSDLAGDEKPYTIVTAYRGIQGVIVRKIFSYYRTFASDTINARMSFSRDSQEEIDRKITRYWDAQQDQDNGGRWWERPFARSLVPGRGGAPAATPQITIGQESVILRLGEFELTTEGRIRGGRLSLFLHDDAIFESLEAKARSLEPGAKSGQLAAGPGRLAKDKEKDRAGERNQSAMLREDGIEAGIRWFASDVEEDLERALCGTSRDRCNRAGPFHTPRGNFLTGDHWNLDFMGGLEAKVPQLNAIGTGFQDIFFELDLSVYPELTRQQWRILQLSVDLRPNSRDYSAMLVFQVANW